MNLLEQ